MLSPLAISNLKPVANSPFKKIEGTSRIEPIALVSSLKEKIPKLASSINHFVIKVIFFAIGSLKSHINVHIIGNQTAGNNTGSITLYNSVDYDFILKNTSHTVALQPIVLSFFNKDDQTYENGFIPDIILCPNEDILDLGVLGDSSEPILERVLEAITSGSTGTSAACNSNNYTFLYNSINAQRAFDSGNFIKQNLPNTN